MGKRTKVKLIIRSIILVITLFLTITNVNLINKIMSFNIIENIKIHHLLWIYLMYEMIIVLVPKFNNYSYSGKIFKRHFREAEIYNKDKLDKFTQKNTKRAINAFIFWIILNSIIGYVYIKCKLSYIYMYLLFLFYYWADMFCVNVWCPFHKLIVKNKCCNECRIYNWGHIMYLTPLIFIPSIWTYSLVLVGLIIFIQWEYMNKKYPERFSPISNKTLRCSECSHDCRYNKSKHKIKYKKYSKNIKKIQ